MTVQLALGRLEETFFFNFEDPIFYPGASVEVLDQLLSLYEEEMGMLPKLVILDEIQNVQGWERWVRKAIDLGDYQIIVTGSSSHLLSSEIATAISGRVIEQSIWPLSFSEYLTFLNKTPSTKGTWLRALEDYLRWGGFPKVILTPDESDRIILLKQYLSDIVLRDVVARHSIKNQRALHQIVSFYLTGLGCLHSYNSLRKTFEISIELASTLTGYLTQAFLVFACIKTPIGKNLNPFIGRCTHKGGENDPSHPSLSMANGEALKLPQRPQEGQNREVDRH